MAVVGIVVGLVIVWAGLVELVGWARARNRLVRVPGVVVGQADVGGRSAAVQSRAARFRFTTRDGRVVEAVSQLSSFPGPRPGTPVSVTYDPKNPQGTAEIGKVRSIKVVLSPLLIVGGLVLAAAAAMNLH